MKEQLRWDYICTLHKVVDEADVVLLVLDAHGPAGAGAGCRRYAGARRRTSGSCSCPIRLVRSRLSPSRYALQHSWIDLVPRENAQLKHLRPMTPTMPFRSVGSRQRTSLSFGTAPMISSAFSECVYKPSAAQIIIVGRRGLPERLRRQPTQHSQRVRWAAFFFHASLRVTIVKTRMGRCVPWLHSQRDERWNYSLFSSSVCRG